MTHLIVPPEAGDDAPNLAVALVAEVAAPTALQPDGDVHLSRSDVDDLGAIVSGLTAAPEVPATLSIRPETVEALLSSPEPSTPSSCPRCRPPPPAARSSRSRTSPSTSMPSRRPGC